MSIGGMSQNKPPSSGGHLSVDLRPACSRNNRGQCLAFRPNRTCVRPLLIGRLRPNGRWPHYPAKVLAAVTEHDPAVGTKKRVAFPGIGAIVAVSSAKGGVGKSTVTVNLALALQRRGKAVGILDADILGPSIPGMLGISTSAKPTQAANGKVEPPLGYGIKAVSMAMFTPADQPMMLRGPMVGKYLSMFLGGVEWGELDVLLLDMPPGTGDTQLTIAQTFPLSGAIIVTTPQAVSVTIAKRGARMFEKVQTPLLGVVENMRTFACPHCGETTDLFGRGGGEQLAADIAAPFLGALPLDPAVMVGGDLGLPAVAKEPDSATARAYDRIAAAIEPELLNSGGGLEPFVWKWDQSDAGPGWNEGPGGPDGSPIVPVGLRRRDARTLSVAWQEGTTQDFDVRDLRLACRCALCVEEMSGRPLIDPVNIPLDVEPIEIRSVGSYAISISWTDGHSSGIQTFEGLRKIGDWGASNDA